MPEPMVNVTRQRRASREKPQGVPAAGRGGGKWWEMRLHRRVKKDFNCPARHRGLSWVKVVEHCRVQVRKSLEPLKALFCQKERTLVPLPPARLADFQKGAEASWCLSPQSRACSWLCRTWSPRGFPESSPKDSLPPRTPVWNEPCLPWAVLPAAGVHFVN